MSLEELRWMVGAWAGQGEDGSFHEEVWIEPRGGMMLGLHRNLRSDGSGIFEFLRIERSEDGLIYHSQAGGDSPIVFPLRDQGPQRIDFQRSFPDFPSTVSYRRDGADLCAAIEGIHRGRQRRLEWRWQPTADS